MSSNTTPTMTADDWDELEAAILGGPATKEPAQPKQDTEPAKIRTSDEIVAEELAKAARLPAEPPDLLETECPPTNGRALGGPASRAQYAPTVRAEVVELRRELSEMTRLVREIHTRVVVDRGKP